MSPTVTQWDVVGRLKATATEAQSPAMIILNQPIVHTPLLETLFSSCQPRVAADGGATRLLKVINQTRIDGQPSPYNSLDIIVGDLDSVTPEALEYFARTAKPAQIVKIADQSSTDFGKAIKLIREADTSAPRDIIAIGGCGGRVDQGVAQLHHLYLFQSSVSRIFLLNSESVTFLLAPGKHVLRVKDDATEIFGKHVGILPMDGTAHITTRGLEWDVTNWETSFSGAISTSNHVLPQTTHIEVETDNAVLFTISLRDAL
ncbi:thiamine pyrophosphokinase [Ceratocystis pirilliformis]|uniref:Thiamine pyrophosphokinase n=1 Tax=Ceratocystis pirilliformis TaxID=259994 RepID=A0ABR3YVK9_9PEZI